MAELNGYRRDDGDTQPPYLHPDHRSTRLRAPSRPLTVLPHTLAEITGPVFSHERIGELDHDLSRQRARRRRRPVRRSLIETWQANAAGRYCHAVDRHPAPLDRNFSGAGRCLTDAEGGYRFVTVKPGSYPWANHPNAWRLAHIHLSLFGPAFATRLVTQMYFPGDPLFFQDPIFNSVRDPAAREPLAR